MGRPRKPTALHVLHGNAGKRPLPKNEPKPALGCEKPPWLVAPLALAEWERIMPRLLRLGVITEIDGEACALMCAHLADAGEQVRMGRAVEPRLTAEIRQFLARFGMDPASRSKVSGKPAEEDDPFAGWTGGKASSGGKKG
jgi:phage terminase small subunit